MTVPEHLRRSSVATKSRGALVDRTTQRWVRATGRRVALDECPWLEGPVGDVDVIGADFFMRFAALAGPACDPSQVDGRVAEFCEQTSEYEFDVWSQWRGDFGLSATRWPRSFLGDCSN